GTVPRERLLVAQAQAERILAARALAQQRGASYGGSLSLANWTEKGPSNIGGRVRAIMPDPSDATGNKVWASSVGGGLWKSNNAAGTTPTWSKIDDTFANLAITTLAYDPSNPDIMYFGTGEGFGNSDASRGLGIWKSTDHGVTWTQLASTNNVAAFYYINRLGVDKNGWVYAATETGGLRRSQNGGTTWTTVLSTPASVSDIDLNPVDGTVYASASNSEVGRGIYRSASGDANTFTNLRTLSGSGLPTTNVYYRVELAMAPSNPSQLYAMYCGSNDALYNIYRSSDGGNTWQALPKPKDADTGIPAADFTRGQAWYDLSIGVSPTDPGTVFIGGVDIFKTSNGTAATAANVAWQQTTHWYGGFGYQNVHADQHAVAFAPGSNSIVYFGNDGGVARSLNATAAIPTITPINTNFNVTQFYAVAVHPTDVNYFLAGAQDNGTQQFRGVSGSATRDVNGGDGAFCAIDQDQPDVQFATYVYCNVYRSNTKGDDFFPDVVEENNTRGSFINPLDYDSQNNVLYYNYSTGTSLALRRAGNANVGTPALSTIALPNLSTTGVAINGAIITHVAVSPNVNDRVYVGTNTGRVLQIDNASSPTPTIATIFDAGTYVSISSIGVEKFAPGAANPDQHILATVSNYGQVSVWQTTNGGTSWANVEGNLPDMPVRWVLPDPTGSKRALIATELGVWSTDDLYAASVVWTPSNGNLANVRVDMLRLRKSDRMVVAATHGRGLFTSDIFVANPLPVELTAFTATPAADAVRLAWSTASEKNSRSFEVERSTDGTGYVRIGTVAAAGTSSSSHSYGLTDAALPAAASLYYRLRQVDADGTFRYSPVRTVARPASAVALAVFPNPSRGAATLNGAVPGAVVRVFDTAGHAVFSTTADAQGNASVLPATGLAAGIYVVRTGSRSTRLVIE
ncbi:T9SS type A sorting domain-containing protein, partial [Hymenobacter agri]